MTTTTVYVHLKPTEQILIDRDRNAPMWTLHLGDVKVLLAEWAGWDLDQVTALLGRLHDEVLAENLKVSA